MHNPVQIHLRDYRSGANTKSNANRNRLVRRLGQENKSAAQRRGTAKSLFQTMPRSLEFPTASRPHCGSSSSNLVDVVRLQPP